MVVIRMIRSSLPLPSRSLTWYSSGPDVAGPVPGQVLARPASQQVPARRRPRIDPRADQHREPGPVRQHLQHRQRHVGPDPPQQRRPGPGRRAPVREGVEVPVREQQPVLAARPGYSRRASACSPLPFPPAAGPTAAATSACEPHSLTVTTRAFGNGAGPAGPARDPKNARFAAVSGTSHSIPSTDISRQPPTRPCPVSATGPHDRRTGRRTRPASAAARVVLAILIGRNNARKYTITCGAACPRPGDNPPGSLLQPSG